MSDKVLALTKDNFDKEVLESDKPVLGFLGSVVRTVQDGGTIIDQIADEYNGRVKVGKVNVDEESELAQKYRIMSIPTLMVFKTENLPKAS